MTYTSGRVGSGQADIFYEETGSGTPVLFCHAGVTDRRMWDPQFSSPIPGYRYVRSDMRGFGESAWVAEPYTPTADLAAVIETLDLSDLMVVGCSMGGRATMELAVRYPDRIRGIVVIGAGMPGWEPEDGGYTPPQWDDAILDPLWESGDWDAIVDIDAEVWMVGVGRDRNDVDPDLIHKMKEMDRKPVATELERDKYSSWAEPELAERLNGLMIPAIVVVGEHDLPDIVAGTAVLAEKISDEDRVMIPDAAHLPSFERPEAFDPIIRRFLQNIRDL